MAWKCDKCGNKYDDAVIKVEKAGYRFCPACLGAAPVSEAHILKKDNSKKLIKILTIVAAAVLFVAIVLGIVLYNIVGASAGLSVLVFGMVATMVILAVDESIIKRHKGVKKNEEQGKL